MYIKRDGEESSAEGLRSHQRSYLGLHGWSGDHTTFAPLVPFLPADARLYSADLPGYGASPTPPRWDVETLADQIAALIDSLPGESLTVIGNCSGAILALLAAPKVESKIERMVLIDPFAYTPWYFRLFVEPWWGRMAYYTAFANPVGRWIGNLSLRGHRTGETDLTGSFRGVDHGVSYRYLRLLTSIDGIGGFAWWRKPVDILYGERTFGAIRESVAMWREIWPQARAWELKGAGHLPILEATAQVAQIAFDMNPG